MQVANDKRRLESDFAVDKNGRGGKEEKRRGERKVMGGIILLNGC